MQTSMQAAFNKALKMNDQLLINQLYADLKIDEGVRYVIYLDSKGIPTIGIGHNCKASPLPPDFKQPLSNAQVFYLFNIDIKKAISDLDRSLPFWRNLDFVRQCVILNMCFNLGISGLIEFHKAIAAMQKGDFAESAKEMQDSKWFGEVGKRAVRLCEEMKSGVKS